MSLLPHISRVFERVIYNQINSVMEIKNLKNCHGFQEVTTFFKSHARKMEKKAWDKEENMSAIFMDLSKAFDSINHDLLLAKLKGYGFSKQALSFMCSYLKKQATKSSNHQ